MLSPPGTEDTMTAVNLNEEITFSFIVPVYNEQDVLEDVYRRLATVADRLGETYEIVFVDDGSQDRSGEILRQLARTDSHVKVVELSRNFGHQLAVTAGYDFAAGQAVISLDADCQHPPEIIPQLVNRWRDGYEVVYTVRKTTAGVPLLRRGIGRLAYLAIRLISGVDLTDQADFRLLDQKAVRALRTTREQARFVRGLVRWIGFRHTAVEYEAPSRAAGQSKYTLRQLAGMAGAGVFNFSLRPLRLAAVLGGVMLTGAVVYGVVAIVLWPLGLCPGAWANVTAVVAGLFGLQFVILGILGEYVGRIFEEAKARPLYIVRQTMGFGKAQRDTQGYRALDESHQRGPKVFT